MGNEKNTITWMWPLISLEWVPEILSSFGNLLEPSWAGLKRQMTTDVQSKSSANRLFSQLQAFLLETSLVEERGRYIHPTVNGDPICTRRHLIKFFEESNSKWAHFFRIIDKDGIALNFDSINPKLSELWSDITNYSIFKQWSEYFQHLGFGILLNHDHFIPNSAISIEMVSNPIFVEQCLKAIGDPRYFTGTLSLHTESDFLAWTIGEEHLPITKDPNLFPRVPHEIIVQKWQMDNANKGSWHAALSKGKENWTQSIEEILSVYPFSNLNSLIYTCKYLLDYFLFGRSMFHTDTLDQETLFSIRKRWNSVKYFIASEQVWKLMPNLYRDITRLYWGIRFYRNSLHKPYLQESKYNDECFAGAYNAQIKKNSIKCYKSKRTLTGILKSFSTIFKSLKRLNDKRLDEYYELETKRIYNGAKTYLPSNPLETSELINQLGGIVEIDVEDLSNILNPISFDISTGHRSESTLNFCFWVHRHYEIVENPHIESLAKIKEKLKKRKIKFLRDCNYYENHSFQWQEACGRLKNKLGLYRTSQ